MFTPDRPLLGQTKSRAREMGARRLTLGVIASLATFGPLAIAEAQEHDHGHEPAPVATPSPSPRTAPKPTRTQTPRATPKPISRPSPRAMPKPAPSQAPHAMPKPTPVPAPVAPPSPTTGQGHEHGVEAPASPEGGQGHDHGAEAPMPETMDHAAMGHDPLMDRARAMGSGTSVLPRTSPMRMWAFRPGGWLWMLHGDTVGGYNQQGGARGARTWAAENWQMAMGSGYVGPGIVDLRLMTSSLPSVAADAEDLSTAVQTRNAELAALTSRSAEARARVGPAGALPDPRIEIEVMDAMNFGGPWAAVRQMLPIAGQMEP